MLVVMKKDATPEQVQHVVQTIQSMGLVAHTIPGAQRVAIGITGSKGSLDPNALESLDGVLEAIRVLKPCKQVSREWRAEESVVNVAGVPIGGRELVVMAGPCAVESYEQCVTIARAVKAAGATLLRGGAFKPRTSPYSFQGLGEEGLKILSRVRDEVGLPVVTEALDPEGVGLVERH